MAPPRSAFLSLLLLLLLSPTLCWALGGGKARQAVLEEAGSVRHEVALLAVKAARHHLPPVEEQAALSQARAAVEGAVLAIARLRARVGRYRRLQGVTIALGVVAFIVGGAFISPALLGGYLIAGVTSLELAGLMGGVMWMEWERSSDVQAADRAQKDVAWAERLLRTVERIASSHEASCGPSLMPGEPGGVVTEAP